MRRFYSIPLLLLIGWSFSSLGQSNPGKAIPVLHYVQANGGQNNSASRAVLYSEDFETAPVPNFPTGWSTSGLVSGFFTGSAGNGPGQANEGGFWPVPPHTTFAMTNDDVCNCDKSEDYLVLPTQDFTSETDMSISFSVYHDGSGGSRASIEVSTNGGGNWTQVYQIPVSSNWQDLEFVRLSGTDNQSSVMIRFHYNDNGSWGSGLAIDDLRIEDLPTHDQAVTDLFYDGITNDSGRAYYSEIPLRHAQLDTLSFGAGLGNLGAQPGTGLNLNVQISGSGNYFGTGSLANLNPGDTQDVAVSGLGFIPSAKGLHQVTFSLNANSGDDRAINNTVVQNINVSDTVYARDNNTYTGQGIWYGSGVNYTVGNLFEVRTTDTLSSISVYFHPATAPNSEVNFRIYSYDGSNFNSIIVPVNEILTVDRIGVWTSFSLPPAPLTPGRYLAAVETVNGNVLMAVSGNNPVTPPGTSFANFFGPWNSTDFTPFIRLNFTPFNDPCAATITPSVYPISCNGLTDGSLAIDFNGPGSPAYSWSNGGSTDSISNLSEGVYDVTVTYGTGCASVFSLGIEEPELLVSNPSTTGEVCGDASGTAEAGVTGGIAPYSYNWVTGDTTATISNLSIAGYNVTVTDDRGCSTVGTATVGGTPGVQAPTTLNDPGCGQNNGQITVSPTAGPGPYIYNWSHNSGLTDSVANGLGAGIYSISVTDANNCNGVFTVSLNNVGAPVIITNAVVDATCFGSATGSIDLQVTGGTPNYSFLWSDNSTGEDLNNVVAGTYQVTVTDGQNCQSFNTVTIEEPDSISLGFTSTGLVCFGDTSASVFLQASGGTPGYNYEWSTGNVGDTVNNLAAGDYIITVTDAQNCEKTVTITIADPDSIDASAVIVDTDPNNLGSIDVTAAGGAEPYTYQWSNGAFTEDIGNLPGGAYFVTITDANGCSNSFRFFVEYPVSVSEAQVKSLEKLRLYPNPNNGTFTISLPTDIQDNLNIEILNSEGRIVYRDVIPNNSTDSYYFNQPSLPPGLYLAHIFSTSYRNTATFILRP